MTKQMTPEWAASLQKSFKFPGRIRYCLHVTKGGEQSIVMTQETGSNASKKIENVRFRDVQTLDLMGGDYATLKLQDCEGPQQVWDSVIRLNETWVAKGAAKHD